MNEVSVSHATALVRAWRKNDSCSLCKMMMIPTKGKKVLMTAHASKKKTRRRDDAARARTNAAQPLDRGPSPHVSCQAKARVPICAPKDRFTRVLAASFTGAPRYTREVFILGSRSSLFSSPFFTKKNQKKPEKTQTPRPAAARRR